MADKDTKDMDGTVLAGSWRAEIQGAARGDYKVSGLKLKRIGNGRRGPAVEVELFGPVLAGSDLREIFKEGKARNIELVGDAVGAKAASPTIQINLAEPVEYSLGTFGSGEAGKVPSCEVVKFEAETWAFRCRGEI